MAERPSELSKTTKEQDGAVQVGEQILAERSFIKFLDSVYILEPPQAGAPTGGRVKFQLWPHIVEFAEQLERPWKMTAEGRQAEIRPEDLQTVGGKARQVGYSWTLAAFVDWLSRFHDGSLSLLLSQGQVESVALLAKCRYIYVNLPTAWQLPFDKDGAQHLSWKGSDSEIIALPSTVNAGQGFTASFVGIDEADRHEYLSESMGAVKPTIDAGGQIALISTVNKRKASSMFQAMYKGAQAGQGGYRKLFVPYMARPGRDEDWYERTRDSMPEEDLKGMSRALYMEENYPRTEEEMLAPPKTEMYYDGEAIAHLLRLCRPPMLSEGPMNIFVKPILGHRYVAATDTSEGVGRDYSVTAIVDLTAVNVPADIMSNEMDTDDLVYWSMKLLEMYRWPLWAPENIGVGRDVARKARDLRYRRLFRMHTKRTMGGADHLREEPGWHTDGNNRWDIFADLRLLIDKGELVIFNRAGLQQFQDVITVKAGRPEARGGANDDYVVAVGIAYQMRKWAGSMMGGEEKMVVRPPSF